MFGDLARHYIKYELGELAEADDQKSHSTIERYLQILNNRLIPRWGNRPALEIEPLEIMQWLKASKRMEDLEMSEDRLAAQDDMLAAMMTPSNAVN